MLALGQCCHMSFCCSWWLIKTTSPFSRQQLVTSKNFGLNAQALFLFWWFGVVFKHCAVVWYLHSKQGAHCQMPTCFSYLQYRLQYFCLTCWYLEPVSQRTHRFLGGSQVLMAWWTWPCGSCTGAPLSNLCPSSHRVCSKDIGQTKATSMVHWHMLLLYPALLLRQPQNEASQARRAGWRYGGEWRTEGPCSVLNLRCQAVSRRHTRNMSFTDCVAWDGEKQMLGWKCTVQSSWETARLGDWRPPRQWISVRCLQVGLLPPHFHQPHASNTLTHHPALVSVAAP